MVVLQNILCIHGSNIFFYRSYTRILRILRPDPGPPDEASERVIEADEAPAAMSH